MSTLLIFLFTGLCAGALVYVVLPYMTGEARAEGRLKNLSKRTVAVASENDAKRRNLADALKKVEDLQEKQKRPPIDVRLQQASIPITKASFFAIVGAAGFIAFLAMLTLTGSFLLAGAVMFITAAGLPNWVINYMIKKRMNRFTSEFPGALDIITRGIKAGLPLNECLNIIAREAPDPVNLEFQKIIEAQQMGVSLSEAVQRLALRMPSSEANFFAISVSIQQKAGGNLAEALGNLARVLRERKQMKQKIKAMSTEATASAGIIACMPPGVGILVYLSSPEYISLLWTTTTGQVTLLLSGCWMGLGVLVMKRMINFEV